MPNAYASVADIRASGGVQRASEANISGQDARILDLVEAVSREIDNWCRRYFYSRRSSLIMESSDNLRMWLSQDLVSLDTLEEDTDWDGDYETTWRLSDYELWPYNAEPTENIDRAKPFERIDVKIRGGLGRQVFLAGIRRYRVTGTWGYSEVPLSLYGITVSAPDADARVLPVLGATQEYDDLELMAVGYTLFLNEEQVYVRRVNADSDGTVTGIVVDRGINGTTAEAHSGVRPGLAQYPQPIREATIIQAARIYSRRSAGFAAELGFDQSGRQTMAIGLDRDVSDMIKPYKSQLV